jgi:pyrroloquinoline quinone biosynthesis protein D
MSERAIVAGDSQPCLPRHVKLRFDKQRDCWVLLAPERVLMPDEPAMAILKRCDGDASVSAIVDQLAAEFDAPRSEIEGDVIEMLQDLCDKGFLRL